MEGKITEVKNHISYFDSNGEVYALLDEDVSELYELSVNLDSTARV